MEIQTERYPAATVIRLKGRLDAHQSKQVGEVLTEGMITGQRTVVNLRNVHFIDSTGLAVLVKAMKRHREESGELMLCELQQPVRIIFELTRLDRVFDMFSAESEALEALQIYV